MSLCLLESLDREEYSKSFLDYCKDQGFKLTESDLWNSYKNASALLVDSTSSQAKAQWLSHPILFSSQELESTTRKLRNGYRSQNFDTTFGIVLLSYWFVICLVAAIFHWSRRLFPKFMTSVTHSRPANYLRAYLILPPLFRRKHFDIEKIGPVEWLTPLRLESVLLFIFFALGAIFCGVEISPVGNFHVALSVGNRSGLLAIFPLPVLILFAGRNNFLQFATGWQYTRFVTFHRWVARIVFLLVVVHCATKTHSFISSGSYATVMKLTFVIWGTVSAVAMGLMMFFSMIWFRRRNYELFLLVHYILAAVMIAGAWIHTRSLGHEGFFIAAIAVWGFNLIVRICRMLAFGVQEATVELKADDTLRVIVNRPGWWKPHPGAHAFVHFLFLKGFWQSHPFTVVDEPVEKNTFGFYIKVKGGITSSLYQKLKAADNQRLTMKVAIEGPYFEKMPTETMDSLVFMASGNGIPGIYAEARHAALKHPHISVKLIWGIRDYSSLCWFYHELKRLECLDIDTYIYVSRADKNLKLSHIIERTPISSEKLDEYSFDTRATSIDLVSSLKSDLLSIHFLEGRPNVRSLVSESVVAAGTKSVGFVTCGHPQMVDEVRAQVVKELSRDSTRKIELFEEFQMW